MSPKEGSGQRSPVGPVPYTSLPGAAAGVMSIYWEQIVGFSELGQTGREKFDKDRGGKKRESRQNADRTECRLIV